MKNRLSLFLIMICSSPVFAMYCPNNFKEINFGDTIIQIKKTCGTPNRIIEIPPPDTGAEAWIYTSKTKSQMTIIFIDEKVSKIILGGQPVSSLLPNCTLANEATQSPRNIQTGNSMDSVKNACGKPTSIIKGISRDGSVTPPPQIVQYQYNTTNPPTLLIFQDGIYIAKR